MVQVTFDTTTDTLEELEQSLTLLQNAISRRKGTTAATPSKPLKPKLDMPTIESDEETAIDTPFLKITVKSDDPERSDGNGDGTPSLNQLLTDDKLTEEELTRMFKEQGGQVSDAPAETPARKEKEEKEPDAYIEIIEYNEEKP